MPSKFVSAILEVTFSGVVKARFIDAIPAELIKTDMVSPLFFILLAASFNSRYEVTSHLKEIGF